MKGGCARWDRVGILSAISNTGWHKGTHLDAVANGVEALGASDAGALQLQVDNAVLKGPEHNVTCREPGRKGGG